MTTNNGMHSDKSGYRYSYSGSDCKAFAFRSDSEKKLLESMQTISFSIHEAKGQARALGFKSVKGFSRSIRQIAGTMIFTVIEDHPLACMMDKTTEGWSVDQGMGRGTWSLGDRDDGKRMLQNKIATLIAPFNIMLVYATESWNGSKEFFTGVHEINRGATEARISKREYGAYHSFGRIGSIDNIKIAGLVLSGIEIITEGIVTSVNDMITEVQVQFIARDVKELSTRQYEHKVGVDLSYDEAYEYFKKEYEKSESWQKYEEDLKTFEEKELGYGENHGLGKLLRIDDSGNTVFVYSGNEGGYTEIEKDSFEYDPETGEFFSVVTTSLNPALFDNGDE